MSTGDATYIKTLNKRILVEKIIEHRSISRIELSRLTGLNRSTVSAQINDLMEDQLVLERPSEISSGGRKPILLQMNENAGYTIGIDIDFPYTRVQMTNLLGKPLKTDHIHTKIEEYDLNIPKIISSIKATVSEYDLKYSPKGLIGIGIGIHGIVNNNHHVVFTPKLNWIDIDLKEKMKQHFNVPIFIDNNANLSVYAEQVYHCPTPDLFSITMSSGIGLGVLKGNQIDRGYQGFSGEIGHMIVEPKGLPCTCGNRGCWELYSSERALLNELVARGLDADNFEAIDFADVLEKYPATIERFLDYLAIGLNNIINIFNPQTIIINSEFLHRQKFLLDRLRGRLHSKMNHYESIVTSILGKDAVSLGGAMLALKHYYKINTLNLSAYEYYK
ncbi:ROK family transcriptional regulator [Bacillaceae bacterium SIJ1]|uniref:ROK family transcriptional regulator n=1 Tax=Litoribacterium kuwaitense TaxID=1398745 RepID=UPI0013EDD23B|nr:ROK family transcriptional regulator [Litoribacterium kuwaitense]NGP45120.1 ROK family transcriptional regulator [Litoribacterium kuwaitense]